MVDPALEGITGPDYLVPIELGKVREYARAVHAPFPCFLQDDQAVIHPTFLSTTGVLWGYTLERPRGTVFEKIDHDLSVPLHAEEAVTFFGPPPRAGERLTARSCLESITTKQGSRGGRLDFLVMLTTFKDAQGGLVAEARATTVTTERDPSDQGWGARESQYAPEYGDEDFQEDAFLKIEPQSGSNLKVGASPGPIIMPALTLKDFVRYAGASGSDNPLHYDMAYAASKGFPGLFSISMQHAGGMASYALRWLGESNVREFRCRFKDLVWAGDVLTYQGEITSLYDRDDRRWADVDLRCFRQPGDVVVEAKMSFELAGENTR